MTTKQLTYKALPSLEIIDGSSYPDLGADAKGAWAWSSALLCPVYWNGTKWLSNTPNAYIQSVNVSNGFNVTVTHNGKKTWLLLLPSATLSIGTVTLPPSASAVDGQEVRITSTQQITKLIVNLNGANAVFGASSVLSADDCFQLGYVKSTNSWYRIG